MPCGATHQLKPKPEDTIFSYMYEKGSNINTPLHTGFLGKVEPHSYRKLPLVSSML